MVNRVPTAILFPPSPIPPYIPKISFLIRPLPLPGVHYRVKMVIPMNQSSQGLCLPGHPGATQMDQIGASASYNYCGVAMTTSACSKKRSQDATMRCHCSVLRCDAYVVSSAKISGMKAGELLI